MTSFDIVAVTVVLAVLSVTAVLWIAMWCSGKPKPSHRGNGRALQRQRKNFKRSHPVSGHVQGTDKFKTGQPQIPVCEQKRDIQRDCRTANSESDSAIPNTFSRHPSCHPEAGSDCTFWPGTSHNGTMRRLGFKDPARLLIADSAADSYRRTVEAGPIHIHQPVSRAYIARRGGGRNREGAYSHRQDADSNQHRRAQTQRRRKVRCYPPAPSWYPRTPGGRF
jgi:hypothetical protein